MVDPVNDVIAVPEIRPWIPEAELCVESAD